VGAGKLLTTLPQSCCLAGYITISNQMKKQLIEKDRLVGMNKIVALGNSMTHDLVIHQKFITSKEVIH
jgi:hypothetical protein